MKRVTVRTGAAVPVTAHAPEAACIVARMVAVPGATVCTRPAEETVAMVGLVDDHEAIWVTSLPLLTGPDNVAVNCTF